MCLYVFVNTYARLDTLLSPNRVQVGKRSHLIRSRDYQTGCVHVWETKHCQKDICYKNFQLFEITNGTTTHPPLLSGSLARAHAIPSASAKTQIRDTCSEICKHLRYNPKKTDSI